MLRRISKKNREDADAKGFFLKRRSAVVCERWLLITRFLQNRKNDEISYEKMLKLRRELSRAVTILEMIKRREKSKREFVHLTVEVFEKRSKI